MQISDFDMAGLSLLAAIFFLGGMVKGALGFGLPLTTMAILPLFVPVDFALAVNALVLPLTNVAQFLQARRMRETLVRFRYVLGGIVLGVPIGATLVSLVSDNGLRIALGCFVLLFIALTLSRPSFAIAAGVEHPVGAGVGFAAGIVGALTTANGPLFVMYLVGLKVDRQLFVLRAQPALHRLRCADLRHLPGERPDRSGPVGARSACRARRFGRNGRGQPHRRPDFPGKISPCGAPVPRRARRQHARTGCGRALKLEGQRQWTAHAIL